MRPTSPPLLSFTALALSLFAGVAAAGPAVPPEPPLVTFDATSVVVAGLAPGGRAALLGVGRLVGGFMPTRVRFAEVLTADSLGEVRFDSGTEPSPLSVWAVVDLATGATALAVPEGGELHRRGMPSRALRQQLDGLDEDRRFLEVLLTRADSAEGTHDGAAWVRAFGDGGDGDDDHATDGNLRILTALLEPLADAPAPPDRFQPGDVLVVIDPDSLEVWTASVPGR